MSLNNLLKRTKTSIARLSESKGSVNSLKRAESEAPPLPPLPQNNQKGGRVSAETEPQSSQPTAFLYKMASLTKEKEEKKVDKAETPESMFSDPAETTQAQSPTKDSRPSLFKRLTTKKNKSAGSIISSAEAPPMPPPPIPKFYKSVSDASATSLSDGPSKQVKGALDASLSFRSLKFDSFQLETCLTTKKDVGKSGSVDSLSAQNTRFLRTENENLKHSLQEEKDANKILVNIQFLIDRL